MTKSTLRLVPEVTLPPIDLKARWNMVVGTPVIPVHSRQRLYDANALHKQAKESWPDLMRTMYAACDAVGISRHSAVRAATKKLPRVFEKAMSEKAGNFSSILDFTRGKIITNNPETILALADHFRPMHNRQTRGFVDNFSRPDEDKMGLRRIKIITDLDNGHLAEIMVLHSGYDALGSELTHAAYTTVRSLEAEYGAVDLMPPHIRAQYDDAQRVRIETNQRLAKEFNLTDLEETRQYYLSHIPFMVVERPMGNLRAAVYPDDTSGHYKIDNSLLSLVGQINCMEISREDFIKESMTHVHMAQKPYARPLQFTNGS
jgi:hypothetical protein